MACKNILTYENGSLGFRQDDAQLNKVVDCVKALYSSTLSAVEAGKAHGLLLHSKTARMIVSLDKPFHKTEAGATPDPVDLENCLKALVDQASGPVDPEEFENHVVRCLKDHCPGFSSYQGRFRCAIEAAEKYAKQAGDHATESGAEKAIWDHCGASSGLPEWAKWGIPVAIVIVVILVIAFAMKSRKSQ